MPLQPTLMRFLSTLPPVTALPESPASAVIARGISHFLKGQELSERLAELEGRRIRLTVEDKAVGFTLRVVGGGVVAAAQEAPEVTISATLQDYVLLARGHEDADTLFFQRRLKLVGDTDLGLHLKNMIDAFEYDMPAHLDAVLGQQPANLLRRGARTLQPLVHHTRARLQLWR